MENLTQIAKIENSFAKIAEIQSQLFDVQKVPLVTNLEGFEAPVDVFGTYTDKGKFLGCVGRTFEPTQPKALFDTFVDNLGHFELENLEYNELFGGSKINFKLQVKTLEFTNILGKKDTTNVRINLITGFDGRTKMAMFLDTYRLICSNGMKAYKTDVEISYKNTNGNLGKIPSMLPEIGQTLNNLDNFQAYLVALDKIQINEAQKIAFVNKCLDIQKDAEISTRQTNIKNQLLLGVETEIDRTGGTLFGLLQGITYYTNHLATYKKDTTETEYLLEGSGAKLANKAQEILQSVLIGRTELV